MYVNDNYIGDADYVFGGERERMLERDTLEEMEKNYMLGCLYWQTQENGPILLSKMTVPHLENTIDFLKKKKSNEIRDLWIKLMSIEIKKR